MQQRRSGKQNRLFLVHHAENLPVADVPAGPGVGVAGVSPFGICPTLMKQRMDRRSCSTSAASSFRPFEISQAAFHRFGATASQLLPYQGFRQRAGRAGYNADELGNRVGDASHYRALMDIWQACIDRSSCEI